MATLQKGRTCVGKRASFAALILHAIFKVRRIDLSLRPQQMIDAHVFTNVTDRRERGKKSGDT